ncbi:glycosyltransferase [Paracoccaceae bacterium]|nr:glycosyltransferase [Paracoccaceae bacterium]
MNFADWIRRKIKLFLIKKDLKRPCIVLAQTKSIAEKLQKTYELEDVRVLNNSVTLNLSIKKEKNNYSLPRGKLLFYPSVYYPHKNIEIFIPLAKIIKKESPECKIIITVEPNSFAAMKFLNSIELMGLKDTIINIGQIPPSQMSVVYNGVDALLMPTLLESFSIVYLEAMYHRIPILTSDMWFARAVCGNAALYFDPMDENDIYKSIEKVLRDDSLKVNLIKKGLSRLSQFPSWEETFTTINSFISECLLASSLSRKNK